MSDKIRVAILDDHQGIIDGYLYRFSSAPDIEIAFTLTYGEDLEPALKRTRVDVLILDVQVPTARENPNPYPIVYTIPHLLQEHPNLSVLVISMHSQRTLINSIMEAGASGYVLKDDQASIRDLPAVVRIVANNGIHISQQAYQAITSRQKNGQGLTARQLETLSLSAAYPGASTSELARRMNVANSTLRNLLSGAYLRLNVRNRTEAVAKARALGLITPNTPDLDLDTQESPPDA